MGDTPWTPGPWKALKGKYGFQIHASTGPASFWIANLKCDSCPANEEANARLIAAAPEMVMLLDELEEYFDQRADAEYFTDSPSPIPNEEMRHLVNIRAILSKIKGQTDDQ